MLRRIIFVLGGPGSGKGTLCQQLESKHDYFHLSIGEMMRNIVKKTLIVKAVSIFRI